VSAAAAPETDGAHRLPNVGDEVEFTYGMQRGKPVALRVVLLHPTVRHALPHTFLRATAALASACLCAAAQAQPTDAPPVPVTGVIMTVAARTRSAVGRIRVDGTGSVQEALYEAATMKDTKLRYGAVVWPPSAPIALVMAVGRGDQAQAGRLRALLVARLL
jgi:hypothetical protein